MPWQENDICSRCAERSDMMFCFLGESKGLWRVLLPKDRVDLWLRKPVATEISGNVMGRVKGGVLTSNTRSGNSVWEDILDWLNGCFTMVAGQNTWRGASYLIAGDASPHSLRAS